MFWWFLDDGEPVVSVEANVFLGTRALISASRKEPTNSQVSAPSYDPIVTSKRPSAFAFCHGWLSWKRRVSFVWNIISVSDGVMVVNLLAKSSACLRRVLLIDG